MKFPAFRDNGRLRRASPGGPPVPSRCLARRIFREKGLRDLRPRPPSTIPDRRSGATDPCPCGSGKKIQEMLRTINVSMIDFWLLRAVTGISAFLLFQIELIISKIFLPHYGGSYLVWGPVSYSSRRRCWPGIFRPWAYSKIWHAAVPLGAPRPYPFAVAVFPRPASDSGLRRSCPAAGSGYFLRLCATIGPVFFVLSTVSVASQMWLCASSLSSKFNPYALYSISNFGSFAALLSYPFVLKCIGIFHGRFGSGGPFISMLGLSIWMFQRIRITGTAVSGHQGPGEAITFSQQIRWLLLGAAGVIIFLAATNIITGEIVPAPLLWVIPLGLYLLSFVLNFREKPWCPSWIVSHISFYCRIRRAFYFFSLSGGSFPVTIALILLCGIQFILCMYCQNRLFALKPKADRHLTFFFTSFFFGRVRGRVLDDVGDPRWSPIRSSNIWPAFVVIATTLILDGKEKSFQPASRIVDDRPDHRRCHVAGIVSPI